MSTGDKMFKGLAWSAIERLSIQALQFIIQIVIARIITPEEYGIMGILYVFIAFSTVFIDSGFTKALIQKKDRTQDDISTVFIFNVAISTFAYIILYFISPIIGNFYDNPELILLLRVLASTLLLNALFTVPITLYTIELDFKSITKINFISAVLSGGVGLYMAIQGYGVWALVGMAIARAICTLTTTWFLTTWKPELVFSIKSFKEMFAFGSNLLVSSILNVSVNKIYDLIIPKVNSIEDLGYYSRGTQFTDFIFSIVNSIFDRVLLPGLTNLQDKIELLVSNTKKIIRSTSLIIVPMFLLLAILAEPIIKFLLTDKWLAAVPIMQIFCFARLVTIISGINVNILYVLGRSDLALKQQYYKLAIRIVFLLLAVKFGIIYIAFAELISTLIHFFINTYYPGKIMGYGATKQIKDLSLIMLAGFIMSLIAYIPVYFIDNIIIKLVVTPIISLPIYYICIRVFKVNELNSLLAKTRDFIK